MAKGKPKNKVKIPKCLQKAARVARNAGFVIETLGNGHLRWTAPDGQWTTTSASPGDSRYGPQNAIGDLRRIGLRV
jgi:hypothetical protein